MMRYLALFGISALSMILTACFSPGIPILGAQLDFMLAAMLCMIFLEKTMTPAFYMTGAAVCMDAFFAKALGFYALQYLLCGLAAYLLTHRSSGMQPIGRLLLFAAGWCLREWLGVVFCFLIDAPVGLGQRLVHSLLPGLVPQVLLCVGVYFCMDKLYKSRFIWPVTAFMDRN